MCVLFGAFILAAMQFSGELACVALSLWCVVQCICTLFSTQCNLVWGNIVVVFFFNAFNAFNVVLVVLKFWFDLCGLWNYLFFVFFTIQQQPQWDININNIRISLPFAFGYYFLFLFFFFARFYLRQANKQMRLFCWLPNGHWLKWSQMIENNWFKLNWNVVAHVQRICFNCFCV